MERKQTPLSALRADEVWLQKWYPLVISAGVSNVTCLLARVLKRKRTHVHLHVQVRVRSCESLPGRLNNNCTLHTVALHDTMVI